MGSTVRTISLALFLGACAFLADASSCVLAVGSETNTAETLAHLPRVFAAVPIVGNLGASSAKIASPAGPFLATANAPLPQLYSLNFVRESDLHAECGAVSRVHSPRGPPRVRG